VHAVHEDPSLTTRVATLGAVAALLAASTIDASASTVLMVQLELLTVAAPLLLVVVRNGRRRTGPPRQRKPWGAATVGATIVLPVSVVAWHLPGGSSIGSVAGAGPALLLGVGLAFWGLAGALMSPPTSLSSPLPSGKQAPAGRPASPSSVDPCRRPQDVNERPAAASGATAAPTVANPEPTVMPCSWRAWIPSAITAALK
jgi:hypothetical protein